MKKLALVLVLVLAFTLTALANPFVDVPSPKLSRKGHHRRFP